MWPLVVLAFVPRLACAWQISGSIHSAFKPGALVPLGRFAVDKSGGKLSLTTGLEQGRISSRRRIETESRAYFFSFSVDPNNDLFDNSSITAYQNMIFDNCTRALGFLKENARVVKKVEWPSFRHEWQEAPPRHWVLFGLLSCQSEDGPNFLISYDLRAENNNLGIWSKISCDETHLQWCCATSLMITIATTGVLGFKKLFAKQQPAFPDNKDLISITCLASGCELIANLMKSINWVAYAIGAPGGMPAFASLGGVFAVASICILDAFPFFIGKYDRRSGVLRNLAGCNMTWVTGLLLIFSALFMLRGEVLEPFAISVKEWDAPPHYYYTVVGITVLALRGLIFLEAARLMFGHFPRKGWNLLHFTAVALGALMHYGYALLSYFIHYVSEDIDYRSLTIIIQAIGRIYAIMLYTFAAVLLEHFQCKTSVIELSMPVQTMRTAISGHWSR